MVDERYEYRTIQIERGAWKKVAEHLHGDVAGELERSGATIFGLWRGEIGFHNDEGIVMSAWATRAHGETEIPSVLSSSVEHLVATVRPTDPSPPTDDGIYAHRWFETTEDNWTEFCELSNAAWPYFEGAFPGTRIVGLWKSLDAPVPTVRALLITRYPTLAVWERSRPFEAERVPGVDEARRRFMRRAELTQRTIVRITRLIPPRPA